MPSETRELDHVLASLASGEHVEWQGRPSAVRWLYPHDWFLVAGGLYIGGLFFVGGVTALSGAGVIRALVGVLCFAAGVYFCIGRLVVRRERLKTAAYVVTNRRAITAVASLRGGHHVKSVWWEDYPTARKRMSNGRTGTVWIIPPSLFLGSRWPGFYSADPSWPGNRLKYFGIVFIDVPDVGAVPLPNTHGATSWSA